MISLFFKPLFEGIYAIKENIKILILVLMLQHSASGVFNIFPEI
jgi:hypothetical protein